MKQFKKTECQEVKKASRLHNDKQNYHAFALNDEIFSPSTSGRGLNFNLSSAKVRNSGEGRKCAAFTLAEVLITLGIIGVVAALTMPSLIQKYQEQVTVNKLKKMYSVLSQAYSMYVNDYGPVKPGDFDWTEEGATALFNIFKPHLKIARDCGTTGTQCFFDGTYKSISGEDWADYSKGTIKNRYYKVMLADGSSIVFRGGGVVNESENIIGEIFYDVNGSKAPNSWGKDLFEFDIKNDGSFFPLGIPGKEVYYDFDNECIPAKNGSSGLSGGSCTAWVVYRGNMDYLHCDDLTWNGKSKCK